MRGILWGTLALVILEVVLQPGAVAKADTASGIFVGAMKRLSDPNFGGIPDAASKRPGLAPTSLNSPAAPTVTVPGSFGGRPPVMN